MQINLDELLAKLEEKLATTTPEPVQKGLTAEDLRGVLSDFSTAIMKSVDEKMSLTRQEGTGSKATVVDLRDADPATYILSKARTGEELAPEDKALVWGLTKEFISQGMAD